MADNIRHIIKACIRGDRSSQKLLFDRYNLKLYAVACNYMYDREDAKEALQEAWIQIFKSLKSYNDEGKLEGWLKTIVIRVCWKLKRKEVQFSEVTDNNLKVVDHAKQVHDKMTCDEVLGMLECLTPTSKTVFKMFVIDQYSHVEISGLLGIEESTSRAHLSKARKTLKEKYFKMNQISQNGL